MASTEQRAQPEEDPVVCEIPVHLAENLRGQLWVSMRLL